jgi:hypothetical protein
MPFKIARNLKTYPEIIESGIFEQDFRITKINDG